MRQLGVLTALLGLVAMATPATAQDFEPHPHLLVQRPVVDFIDVEGQQLLALVGFRKCVELAAGQPVPIHAHHDVLHFGETGQKLFNQAGHVVVPTAPFGVPVFDPVGWSNCDEFAAVLPLPLPPDLQP